MAWTKTNTLKGNTNLVILESGASIPDPPAAGVVYLRKSSRLRLPETQALITSTTAALTPLAASAAAGELFAAAKATRRKMDLANCTQARLTCMVIATGNVVAMGYKLQYATAENATWASSTGVADAGPTVVIGTNGGAAGVQHDSGWVDLVAGAKIDNCFLAVVSNAATGTTAPTIGSLILQVR